MTREQTIRCRGLSKRYGDRQVLEAVDLTVHEGQVHALVGLNGAGKTTLMRLILGMITPDAGSVLVYRRAPASMRARHWRGIGHFVESPLAYPELTVTENLRLAALLYGLPRAAAASAAERWIDELVLTSWAHTRVGKLSQGNRQRVGLAAALIADPSVLILDEPANALDPAGILLVRTLLARYRDHGATILVSSHHLDQLARVADQITVLNTGHLAGTLDPAGIDLERQFFDLVERDSGARG